VLPLLLVVVLGRPNELEERLDPELTGVVDERDPRERVEIEPTEEEERDELEETEGRDTLGRLLDRVEPIEELEREGVELREAPELPLDPPRLTPPERLLWASAPRSRLTKVVPRSRSEAANEEESRSSRRKRFLMTGLEEEGGGVARVGPGHANGMPAAGLHPTGSPWGGGGQSSPA